MESAVHVARLRAELSSAQTANIFHADEEEGLKEVIGDYYIVDPDYSDRDSSSSDGSESDTDEGFQPQPSTSSAGATCSVDDGDSDGEDLPYVQDTSVPSVDINISQDVAMPEDKERERVLNFDCACGIKPATTAKQQPTKKGCISQFSLDEIFDRRLNMLELTEGKIFLKT